ncbi:MAG: hypothetical protein E7334_05750 [Clostridiales bacterium]|nr:hypothetical protein [Clostridiales bacterium]
MHYFTWDNEKLTCHAVNELPAEPETMFQSLRKKYTISFYVSRWEDEMTAPGKGFDYNNSYGYNREPFRSELVLRSGSFLGFYIGDNFLDPDPKYILSVSNPFIRIDDKSRLACYKRWELIVQSNPSPCEYVFLARVCGREEDHIFTTDEFPDGIAESISDSFYLEDSDGRFSGIFCVTLKLSSRGVNDPDAVLKKLQEYQPILVRE